MPWDSVSGPIPGLERLAMTYSEASEVLHRLNDYVRDLKNFCSGDRTAVEAEHARNKSIGQATGCWKSGMLAEDGQGAVAAALAQDAGQE